MSTSSRPSLGRGRQLLPGVIAWTIPGAWLFASRVFFPSDPFGLFFQWHIIPFWAMLALAVAVYGRAFARVSSPGRSAWLAIALPAAAGGIAAFVLAGPSPALTAVLAIAALLLAAAPWGQSVAGLLGIEGRWARGALIAYGSVRLVAVPVLPLGIYLIGGHLAREFQSPVIWTGSILTAASALVLAPGVVLNFRAARAARKVIQEEAPAVPEPEGEPA